MVRILRKRKSAPRRKVIRKGRVYKKKSGFKGQGYMKVVRQSRPWVIKNTAVAGVASVTGYSGAIPPLLVCQLGSPEQDTNFSQNIWNVPFALQFNLAQALGFNEFTQLFDKYRLRGVQLKLKYNGNTFDGSNTAGRAQNQPVLKYVIDNDDQVPQPVQTFNEKMGIKSIMLNENRYSNIFVRPKYSVGIDNGTSIGAAGQDRNMWINCADDTIPHFGVKGYIEGMPLGTTASLSSVLQVEMKLYLEFKDVQ